jgi:hypothetical protein
MFLVVKHLPMKHEELSSNLFRKQNSMKRPLLTSPNIDLSTHLLRI